jgi:hypothetical protein
MSMARYVTILNIRNKRSLIVELPGLGGLGYATTMELYVAIDSGHDFILSPYHTLI